MTDPREIVAQAVEDSRDPRARRRTRLWGIAALVLMLATAVIGGYAIRSAQEGEDQATVTARNAKANAAQASADRRAALAAIGQACADGSITRDLRYLCDQARQIREAPPPPPQEGELQEREIQEPERQQGEQQQPERQQVERQDREFQQREAQDRDPNDLETQDEEVQQDEQQDDEVQDEEIQEPEDQEAEIQEDEVQDEERDDPDPNSALEFAVDDQCNPPAGEFVTDVSASWQRSPGTVTLVLTCASAAVQPATP